MDDTLGQLSLEVRMVGWARIVLAAAEGLKALEICDRVGCSEVTKWRGRYERDGMAGLRDAPVRGAVDARAAGGVMRLSSFPKSAVLLRHVVACATML
jgi:hypothetical protein